MVFNISKHSAELVNRSKTFIATFLLTEGGGFLLQENGGRLIISASFGVSLTNQTKHGV